jgi:hypothetical protein
MGNLIGLLTIISVATTITLVSTAPRHPSPKYSHISENEGDLMSAITDTAGKLILMRPAGFEHVPCCGEDISLGG